MSLEDTITTAILEDRLNRAEERERMKGRLANIREQAKAKGEAYYSIWCKSYTARRRWVGEWDAMDGATETADKYT
jgi:hypothetical protein